MDSEMITFQHTGDIGDIIYSLPTIKALGGGTLYLSDHPKTAHRMTEEKVHSIRSLLIEQEYISEVIWSSESQEHKLDNFRNLYGHGNLADMHLATHGLSWEHRTKKWITLPTKPLCTYPIIVSRSPRYNNPNFPWKEIVTKYKNQVGFIGTREEYATFCLSFGFVSHIYTPNLLSIAQVIQGSQLFIGNQSAPAAIAEGLKHKMILEVSPYTAQHSCIYQRLGCILGWDHKLELPELEDLQCTI